MVTSNTQSNHEKVLASLKQASVKYSGVWFYGSRARGDHNSDSDWDYLVVLHDDCHANYIDYVQLITKLAPFPNADLQPKLARSCEGEGSVGWWAKKEGYLIS